MTEIVVGKEALLHLLKIGGINHELSEPLEGEFYGTIETAFGFMTFRYPESCEKRIKESVENEKKRILEILEQQKATFESDLDDPNYPFSIPYRDGKINGLRIAIAEVEAQ